jgi:hypothetical protein
MPQGQPSDPPAPAAQAAVASPTGVVIRPMGPDDAGQVLAFYQAGPDTGLASFETTAPQLGGLRRGEGPCHTQLPI